MSLTIEELKEKMSTRLDEITILELLEVDATELCDRCTDLIEDRYEYLMDQIGYEGI